MINVNAREVTDDLVSLARQLEELVAKNEDKQLRAYVTIVTDDPDAVEAKLKEIAEKHNIKNVPLTIFDGDAGPPQLRLSKDAEVTVLMWKGTRVQVNRGYEQGKFNKQAVQQVVSDAQEKLL